MSPCRLPSPLLQGGLLFFEMDELNDLTLIYLNVKAKIPGLTIIENIIYLLSICAKHFSHISSLKLINSSATTR